MKKDKEITYFGGNTHMMLTVGDRNFFSVTGSSETDSSAGTLATESTLLELKDGKTRTVEVKGYKKAGNIFEKMFYSNGKIVVADA